MDHPSQGESSVLLDQSLAISSTAVCPDAILKDAYRALAEAPNGLLKRIRLALLRQDPRLRVRVKDDEQTIQSYVRLLEASTPLPPPLVILTEHGDLLVADGWHVVQSWRRYTAKLAAERGEMESMAPISEVEIDVELHRGDARDAFLLGLARNNNRGLRLTNKDKTHAVMLMLADAEWQTWSSRMIGDACGCSDRFVDKLRMAAGVASSIRVGRDGRTTRVPRKKTLDNAASTEALTPNGSGLFSATVPHAVDTAPGAKLLPTPNGSGSEAHGEDVLAPAATHPKAVRLSQHQGQLLSWGEVLDKDGLTRRTVYVQQTDCVANALAYLDIKDVHAPLDELFLAYHRAQDPAMALEALAAVLLVQVTQATPPGVTTNVLEGSRRSADE